MFTVSLVRAWLTDLRQRLADDMGSPTLEVVILAAVLAAAAIAASAYVVTRIMFHAHQIK